LPARDRVRHSCVGFLPVILVVVAALASGCGYHVAGRAAKLPATWKTLAVPAFVNRTTRYRVEQRLTDAVIRELLARTTYRVVQEESSADAVLHGQIATIETSPVLFDSASGRVTAILVTLHGKVQLLDRASQKIEYQDDNFVFRDEYQISTDITSFFEEQDPALERMARDFASRLVAEMLEKF
jgi:outer membrane lipopolysaccharide assembly protein LptE/RlpB